MINEIISKKVRLRKSGNSYCATLPRKILKKLNIKNIDLMTTTIEPIISLDEREKKIIIDFGGIE